MKYSLSFAFLAILICYLAVSQGGLWYLLLWFAISFIALAVGYAGVGPRIFSKNRMARYLSGSRSFTFHSSYIPEWFGMSRES